MRFKADEIVSVLETEIEQYRTQVDAREVGRVLEVGDGIARVYGLSSVMAGEMVESTRTGVRGSGRRILTDLVSLVRFATETDGVLRPFTDTVQERFLNWLAEQERAAPAFTDEQRLWLEAIAEHIGASVSIAPDDLEETPFSQRGGLARAYQLFGDRLTTLLDELNERLVA